ncbi:uncharacterized protein I303_107784 [Kwoniella dejecticola CBS 10117]|uniref:Uncharacterized protein n=1 Tax=Kwoniella dejecticola CBS 10117 TaxID=1296121 RepID=A0A1A5ZVP8_9TREE|nr:uncharacterized protein I303_07789 [Kwoniella dejecticola CBS 10117]OBR81879.1 hypothetical protein I303_07789 [Kwoniella dejecticola CBS 10117]
MVSHPTNTNTSTITVTNTNSNSNTRNNKRQYPSNENGNSPFSHVAPCPLPLPSIFASALQHPYPYPYSHAHAHRYHDPSIRNPDRGRERSPGERHPPLYTAPPFTSNPLSYPPPGAIVSPSSATQPSFTYQPHQHRFQQQQQTQPQREIKFIFETGRKEPKAKKFKPPKDAARGSSTEGRKILTSKSVKDPNIAANRRPKPAPLNFDKPPAKQMMGLDHSTHMPSPPLTAGLLPHRELPQVSDYPPYEDYIRPSVNVDSYRFPVATTLHRGNTHGPAHRQHDTRPPTMLMTMNVSRSDPFESPPLPIDAPIPKAPLQAYTPVFEDGNRSFLDDDPDGEHEMEIDFAYQPSTDAVGLGLGLELGLRVELDDAENKEMMDFIPRKPSLTFMMDSDSSDRDVDDEVEVVATPSERRGLIGLGL